MGKRRRVKSFDYNSDNSESSDHDVFETSQQWEREQKSGNKKSSSKTASTKSKSNDTDNASSSNVNHFAQALQSALTLPTPKRAAHVFDRAAAVAAGTLVPDKRNKQQQAKKQSNNNVSDDNNNDDDDDDDNKQNVASNQRKRKRDGQQKQPDLLIDPILAGTRTTQQRNAVRLSHQMSKDMARERRRLLLNQFHDPHPEVNEHEKRLSRLGSQGVVQLFNALKKQRKEWKAKRAGAILSKEKKAAKITPGSFFDTLSNEKTAVVKSTNNNNTPKNKSAKPTSKWDVLRDDFLENTTEADWNDIEASEDRIENSDDS